MSKNHFFLYGKAFLQQYFSLESKREKLFKKAPEGPLKNFLAIPFPPVNQLLYDTEILSVDFETTGFNAKVDQILSIGYTTLHRGQISLVNNAHHIVKTEGNLVEENVVIHNITDQHKSNGIPLKEAVESLLEALAGKVMLVHYSQIERTFLQQACCQLYGLAPVFPMLDTLLIAKRRKDKLPTNYDPSELRLHNLRKEHHLPAHFEHNALNDAVATAELLLAEASLRNQTRKILLSKYLL